MYIISSACPLALPAKSKIHIGFCARLLHLLHLLHLLLPFPPPSWLQMSSSWSAAAVSSFLLRCSWTATRTWSQSGHAAPRQVDPIAHLRPQAGSKRGRKSRITDKRRVWKRDLWCLPWASAGGGKRSSTVQPTCGIGAGPAANCRQPTHGVCDLCRHWTESYSANTSESEQDSSPSNTLSI